MRVYSKAVYTWLRDTQNYFSLHFNVRFVLAHSKLLQYLVTISVLCVCSEHYCDNHTQSHLARALHYQQFSVYSPTQVAKIAMKTEGDFMCGLVDLTDI